MTPSRFLERNGFTDIRVLSSDTGHDLPDDALDASAESALQFWGTKPPR